VANGVLVCRAHHSIIHRDHWDVILRDGLPWLVPPPWLDARQTPRLHSRYQVHQLDP
jgi:hypothetical protein